VTSIAPPPASQAPATTHDAFLGDRLQLLQPAAGYRAGVDAVLLAAAVTVPVDTSTTVLDCGAGVGTVGLCVAARCPNTQVTLIEREPALLDLARHNIKSNELSGRVTALPGDITAPATHIDAPFLEPELFDHVLANPPFHDEAGGTHARAPLKRASHAMQKGELEGWVRFGARMAKPGGRMTLIHKADALPALLDVLKDRFGGLCITPIHSYADRAAIRVLVSGIKGSRAPCRLEPSIVLHDPGGSFTPYVSRILRHGAPLIPSTKD
jgi:FkbM family methyltransferase